MLSPNYHQPQSEPCSYVDCEYTPAPRGYSLYGPFSDVALDRVWCFTPQSLTGDEILASLYETGSGVGLNKVWLEDSRRVLSITDIRNGFQYLSCRVISQH